ncbi:hypothetical protein PATSB16_18580 [Pandoraea thiooxydans]|uniref:Polymer-forming cytoskeletal protein n=1 Tax=Pandoraea thiooxydans TaxID=445709 RepID=A0A0G3EM04_9BURK|nr:polymer-forming cytoskeletal protein [Pandoraea thiooxydans]AKJ67980.1 hypothetical protein ABW99_06870 [Pandoraea thiooxydans]APR95198.1 hypothetical protein PATSB16_18580 [Pandoraea thiooxydans]
MNLAWLYFVAFGTTCLALMWLAFHPAWQEWRTPTDRTPLAVFPNYTSDIDHFAEKFRGVALSNIAGEILAAHETFEHVPEDLNEMNWALARRPLIAYDSIKTAGPVRCKPPLFVQGGIEASSGDSFTALFAQGSIRLGPDSEVLEWAYADDVIYLGEGSCALRRISSATAVELDKRCCFERISAPVVRFGVAPDGVPGTRRPAPVEASFDDLPNVIRRGDSVHMVRGNCELPDGKIYRGSLIVTGRLLIGAWVEIDGDIKGRKDITVGAHARILGSLISEKQIQVRHEAFVEGPVISETIVYLGVRAKLGTSASPTTISAGNIFAEAGAIAHGTVWARDLGVVWSI